jgi:hypothetical protein
MSVLAKLRGMDGFGRPASHKRSTSRALPSPFRRKVGNAAQTQMFFLFYLSLTLIIGR